MDFHQLLKEMAIINNSCLFQSLFYLLYFPIVVLYSIRIDFVLFVSFSFCTSSPSLFALSINKCLFAEKLCINCTDFLLYKSRITLIYPSQIHSRIILLPTIILKTMPRRILQSHTHKLMLKPLI